MLAIDLWGIGHRMKDATVASDELPNIGAEINTFVRHAESISHGFMVAIIIALQEVHKAAKAEFEKFEADYCTVEGEGNERTFSVPGDRYSEWRRMEKHYHTTTLSLVNFPRSLLVSLVSHFDAYVGRLIRAIYLRKPELLNSSERKLSFEELVRYDSIEAVREFVIEKEVESVLRGSHVEQFRWMERTYDVPLTKGLDSWPLFVELMERRNLFVHTDGIVSSQYLAVCKQHHCLKIADANKGDKLGVPQDYFDKANDCVLEIGVKLGHVLWRKIFEGERVEADKQLIQTTYDLLVAKRYAVAARILDFACLGIKKHASEVFKLMLIVNRAIAYKWMGDEKMTKESMKGIDWSAKGDEFKLAKAVLSEDWTQASALMRKIGTSDSVTKQNYRDWPLFKDWRQKPEFKNIYQEVFKEDFDAANVQIETSETQAQLESPSTELRDLPATENGVGSLPT